MKRGGILNRNVCALIASVPTFLETLQEEISHEELKNRTGGARAAIRTGECTPYADILLRSGVAF